MSASIPTAKCDVALLTARDRHVLCLGCHRKPRRNKQRVPLGVWIGAPTFAGPAVAVCHVCIARALIVLGLPEESGKEPPP